MALSALGLMVLVLLGHLGSDYLAQAMALLQDGRQHIAQLDLSGSVAAGGASLAVLPLFGFLSRTGLARSPAGVSLTEVDILEVEEVIRSFGLETCMRNSTMLIYFLRSLGEKARLGGMFRKGEGMPFQYVTLTEKWGKRDIAPYDDECEDYEGTREAREGDYERCLSDLERYGYLIRADKELAKMRNPVDSARRLPDIKLRIEPVTAGLAFGLGVKVLSLFAPGIQQSLPLLSTFGTAALIGGLIIGIIVNRELFKEALSALSKKLHVVSGVILNYIHPAVTFLTFLTALMFNHEIVSPCRLLAMLGYSPYLSALDLLTDFILCFTMVQALLLFVYPKKTFPFYRILSYFSGKNMRDDIERWSLKAPHFVALVFFVSKEAGDFLANSGQMDRKGFNWIGVFTYWIAASVSWEFHLAILRLIRRLAAKTGQRLEQFSNWPEKEHFWEILRLRENAGTHRMLRTSI